MSDDRVLIGGREKRTIVLQDWDPTWSTTFDTERQRIAFALGDVARRIEHVGSTSVTGLAAKPMIDARLSVDDVEDEDSYIGPMERAGYVLRVRDPGHRIANGMVVGFMGQFSVGVDRIVDGQRTCT